MSLTREQLINMTHAEVRAALGVPDRTDRTAVTRQDPSIDRTQIVQIVFVTV